MPERHDRFVDNGDQTVTDGRTGLLWSVQLFGKGEDGQLQVGGQGFSWSGATSRFGRGRRLVAAELSHWPASRTEITAESYRHYVTGKERVTIGGRSDWRLPTAEEFWSLVRRKTSDPNFPNDYVLSTALLGDRMNVWAANYYGWLGPTDYCAWWFTGGTAGGSHVIGDISHSARYHVRLVCGGNVFSVEQFSHGSAMAKLRYLLSWLPWS